MSRVANFDKIAVGELHVNFLGPTTSLEAKAKLVSTKNGSSYGSTTIRHWSVETLRQLDILRAMMEDEMEKLFFEEEQVSLPGVAKPVGGIGEHLGGDDLVPPA